MCVPAGWRTCNRKLIEATELCIDQSTSEAGVQQILKQERPGGCMFSIQSSRPAFLMLQIQVMVSPTKKQKKVGRFLPGKVEVRGSRMNINHS